MYQSTTLKSENVGLTPMQRHLVSMLSFNDTEEAQLRLKAALESFYLSEFERMKQQLFADGSLSEGLIEQAAKTHFRTPY